MANNGRIGVNNMMTPRETVRLKNEYRIKASEALDNAGMSIDECDDSVVPACCKEGCMVEPDGSCEHDCPSVLLALGVI
jgi:hypothetical protein